MQRTALIVNDNPVLLIFLEALFKNIEGWIPVPQPDAMEATAYLEDCARTTRQVPDLIVADIEMPEVDGFQFITYLRRNNKFCSIPVIVASAGDHREQLLNMFGPEIISITMPAGLDGMKSITENLFPGKV